MDKIKKILKLNKRITQLKRMKSYYDDRIKDTRTEISLIESGVEL